MPAYVKFQTPPELQEKILKALEVSKSTGKVRIGTNETTKAIERSAAKFVVIAEDVQPEEVVMHLPLLCSEKKVPYAYVKSKADLGRAAGINVSTAAVAVINEGEAKQIIAEIVDMLKKISK
jgi:large subunit ribosomal protein L7Ae